MVPQVQAPAEGGLAADDEALGVSGSRQVGETTAEQDRLVTDGTAEVGAAPPADEGGPEDWLLLAGIVLAGAGALLLLLGWLSRRADDPLLR